MDKTELQLENQRLKKELERASKKHAAEIKKHAAAKEQHAAEVVEFSKSFAEQKRNIGRLEHQIKILLQNLKGSRQERINPDQLTLFSLEELRIIAEQNNQGDSNDLLDIDPKQKNKRRRRKRDNGKLPSHLPREIIRHELDEKERGCPCCGKERHEMGVESSEQLELIPAQLKVIQHDRVKYACRDCQANDDSGNVAIADKPPQPIEKGLPAPGLCAYSVLSKFGDHTPLYRTEDITSRYGYTIRRSTLCGWQSDLAELALPLVMRMKFLLLQSKVIHTDDTSVKLLEGGPAHTAKFWPYVGDWEHPYTVFDFTRTRGRDGPKKFLSDYEGFLQADAYSGYDAIYAGNKVKEVACWIHARRYWHQAQDNDPVRATKALSYIARLSQIEKQLRESYPRENLQGHRDLTAVAAARQEHSIPILRDFKSWLDEEKENKRILPKSPIRAAFTYTLNQWEALERYTSEGYLAFDNNLAERMVKIPAIGRKNFLFVGSMNGGHRAAIHYSLVSSAKSNGVEPFAWLKTVFERLPYHRSSEAFQQSKESLPITSDELDYLLPDIWLTANPTHKWTIDQIRRSERESKNV